MCTAGAIDFADLWDTVGVERKLGNISGLKGSELQHITEFGRNCSRKTCILDPDGLCKTQNNNNQKQKDLVHWSLKN